MRQTKRKQCFLGICIVIIATKVMLIQKMVIRHLSLLQDELPCICFGVIVKVIRSVESPASSP